MQTDKHEIITEAERSKPTELGFYIVNLRGAKTQVSMMIDRMLDQTGLAVYAREETKQVFMFVREGGLVICITPYYDYIEWELSSDGEVEVPLDKPVPVFNCQDKYYQSFYNPGNQSNQSNQINQSISSAGRDHWIVKAIESFFEQIANLSQKRGKYSDKHLYSSLDIYSVKQAVNHILGVTGRYDNTPRLHYNSLLFQDFLPDESRFIGRVSTKILHSMNIPHLRDILMILSYGCEISREATREATRRNQDGNSSHDNSISNSMIALSSTPLLTLLEACCGHINSKFYSDLLNSDYREDRPGIDFTEGSTESSTKVNAEGSAGCQLKPTIRLSNDGNEVVYYQDGKPCCNYAVLNTVVQLLKLTSEFYSHGKLDPDDPICIKPVNTDYQVRHGLKFLADNAPSRIVNIIHGIANSEMEYAPYASQNYTKKLKTNPGWSVNLSGFLGNFSIYSSSSANGIDDYLMYLAVDDDVIDKHGPDRRRLVGVVLAKRVKVKERHNKLPILYHEVVAAVVKKSYRRKKIFTRLIESLVQTTGTCRFVIKQPGLQCKSGNVTNDTEVILADCLPRNMYSSRLDAEKNAKEGEVKVITILLKR